MAFPVVDGMRVLELGAPGQMRDRLNALVFRGEKRSTAGLMDDYTDEPFEFPGELLVVVDSENRRVGIVRVTDVHVCDFGDVPWSFAQAEHEGDSSVEEWRDGHRRFWASEGIDVLDTTPVVLVYFTLVEGEGSTSSSSPVRDVSSENPFS